MLFTLQAYTNHAKKFKNNFYCHVVFQLSKSEEEDDCAACTQCDSCCRYSLVQYRIVQYSTEQVLSVTLAAGTVQYSTEQYRTVQYSTEQVLSVTLAAGVVQYKQYNTVQYMYSV